jgi:hypothetical protein
VLASKSSAHYHLVSKTISDKKETFKVALKRYLNTHTFYSVDEFLQFRGLIILLGVTVLI